MEEMYPGGIQADEPSVPKYGACRVSVLGRYPSLPSTQIIGP